MYPRFKNTADAPVSSAGKRLIAVPLTSLDLAAAEAARPEAPKAARGWFRYVNLKIESAVFLLIVLTFAAVLGENAITRQQLVLTPRSGQYLPYAYTDTESGGKSSIRVDPAQPMSWSCTLATGFAYPYCGYGLQFDSSKTGKGLDFSHYSDVTIRLVYHGAGNHLKLLVKNYIPANLKGRAKEDVLPMAAEFDVVNGVNEIHLKKDELFTERWWIRNYNFTLNEARPELDNIKAIVINSGSGTPPGTFDVKVQSIEFQGTYLSTQQWYLIILGVWLVATGAFLVHRFLLMRRRYEQHRQVQDQESEALAAARAAAEAASAAKSQFLANMSHELRTPLNAILGYAELLKKGDLTGEQQATAIDTIQQSGEHLLTMISDVLDIAKVEAGKMELLDGPFDIRTCVTTVAEMIRLRAEDKGLRFVSIVAPEVPHDVIADQKRVRQVLINLLANAVKFTAAGEVRLEVSATPGDGDTVRLRFDVIDTGVGIPRDQINRIFRPFEQVGNAIDRSGGTGLGLSITAQIVRMMHGDISVDSAPGAGSRFTVDVPLRLSSATAPIEEKPAVTAPPDDQPRLIAPAGEVLDRLLVLARAGNLGAIRKEIHAIQAMGPQYHGFAERLDALAAAWQSPAVLRLIEQCAQDRSAA